jgi:NAD(P)-dependent dehydrogenase (short-subunit alcohol dehydrogenase family)
MVQESDQSAGFGRLAGKRTIVTGAGSGIGRASARLFASEGASVLAVDRNRDAVEETINLIESDRSRASEGLLIAGAGGAGAGGDGGRVVGACADVGRDSDVTGFISQALDELGGLDVVFANAGISGGDIPLDEQTVDLWQEVLRINLIGAFLCVKHAGRHMVAQGHGSIVCTASVAGLRANAGGTPYSASKAGVISLVQTSANSFWGTGVRINAICPGLIETGMTRPIFDHARSRGTEDKLGQINPLQRFGLPHEIASVALFLASDDASYVNGQAIAVDGGLTSTLPFKRRLR